MACSVTLTAVSPAISWKSTLPHGQTAPAAERPVEDHGRHGSEMGAAVLSQGQLNPVRSRQGHRRRSLDLEKPPTTCSIKLPARSVVVLDVVGSNPIAHPNVAVDCTRLTLPGASRPVGLDMRDAPTFGVFLGAGLGACDYYVHRNSLCVWAI
jgi:hypothetical protein